MKRLVLIVALLTAGCGVLAPKAPPNLPPAVTAQFYATYAIKDLDAIRDFAADINRVAPEAVSNATLLKIVNWHESLITVIHRLPSGWKAATVAGLNELRHILTDVEYVRFKPYVEAVRTFVSEVQ